MKTDLEQRLAQRQQEAAVLPPIRVFEVTLFGCGTSEGGFDPDTKEIVEGHSVQYSDSGILAFQTITVDSNLGPMSRVTRIFASGTWRGVVEVVGLRMPVYSTVN